MGLGRNKASLVVQAYQKYGGVFAYCLPSTSSSTGFLTFGSGSYSSSSNVKFTPMLTDASSPSFYFLDLVAISVGGQRLPISATVFSNAGTIIDSGTVISRLPPTAYSALRSAFRQGMSSYKAAAPDSLLDTCYDFTGYTTVSIPTVALEFSDGVTMNLDFGGILYALSQSQVCLAFATNSDDGDLGIVGNVQQRTFTSDPAAASLPDVVRQVEAKLGLDLSHKAAFIRDQIELLLRPSVHPLPPHPQSQATAGPHNPYILLHHLPLQQQIPPPKPTSSAGVAAPAPFPQHHHPGIAFQYPPPPPLPAAAVVAAYHLQQQLHQAPQGVPAAVGLAPVTVAMAAPKESAPPRAKRKGGPGGLNKVCGVSPELQPIVGEAAMSRTQIVKQLWAYIRKNNLQDPNNKRKIICNDELRRVFETDSTDMFKMNKLLSKHIIPLDYPKDTGAESKKLKAADVSATEITKPDSDEYPMVISDSLAKFFGSEEREILKSVALSRVWDYIKANQLEDSANSSILCDPKLQELFGCESLPVSGISDLLANHLLKKS
ncbi:unnamed protein product [Musa banksii]